MGISTSTLATAPDGRDYQVSVEWFAHGRQWLRRFRERRRKDDGLDPSGMLDLAGAADDLIAGIAIFIGVIVVGLLLWFLVIPAVFLLLDIVLIVVLVVGGAAFKIVFRRPWTVAVRADGYDEVLAKGGVLGWRAAGNARETIAQTIRAGIDPAAAVQRSTLPAH